MTHPIKTLMSWIIYPLVMAATLIIYFMLVNDGIKLSVSSYIAAILGAGFITLLEFIMPYRKEWLPNWREARTDLIFMALIQIALPMGLSLLAALFLQQMVSAKEWNITGWWPHHYPVWVQMLLMMFVADFFRYWLHRAMHEWKPLWRFHAVHHSSQKLSWVNVGRFHPFDKAFQYVGEVIPFVLLGVSKEVLALYFVVYSIKGFFQHSNVDIKLGIFNYIISGPELHRWHHSKHIKESNQNYGNNIIVWDILFGTRFLPKNRSVGDLGLLNRYYPMDFLSQMKTPFIKGSDKPQ